MIAIIFWLAIFSIGISFLEWFASLHEVWNDLKGRSVDNVSFITLV